MTSLTVTPVTGIPELGPGDDLAAMVAGRAPGLEDGDVVVVAQKAVSKTEGRLTTAPKPVAVEHEAARILRRTPGGMVIAETRHGFVCANAGVDESNLPPGTIALLPLDPDLSARRLRTRLERLSGAVLGVIVSDTFGRAWRIGQTNVAIGVAGIEPFLDHRGSLDSFGRPLTATVICVADEIAAAAELVMGKSEGICAAVVRGAPVRAGRGTATRIVRPPAQDLFR